MGHWKRRGRSGFTLLELMIVVLLLGIIGLSIGYLYTAAQRFLIQSVNFTGTQNEASLALEHIKRNLLVATAIALPTVGNPGSTLRFTWQRSLPRGGVQDVTSEYTLAGTNLQYTARPGAGGAETVARNVSAITFTRTDATTVAINLTSQQSSGGDTRKTRLETTVTPRGVFQ